MRKTPIGFFFSHPVFDLIFAPFLLSYSYNLNYIPQGGEEIKMNRKLIVLVLAFAVGLVGCTGNVPASATIAPTLEPTAVPSPTPTAVIPTEVPTPEPTPTEVPLYIGLPGDKVNALRETCLKQNPDSFCLPLPVDPNIPGFELAEADADDDPYINITGTDGVTFVAPVSGLLQYACLWDYNNSEAPYPGWILFLMFIWDSDKGMDLNIYISRPDSTRIEEGDFTIADGCDEKRSFFSLSQPKMRQTGEILAKIEGSFQIGIFAGFSEDTVKDALLRNEYGSIVYVLPSGK